jgi:hypothetical protein
VKLRVAMYEDRRCRDTSDKHNINSTLFPNVITLANLLRHKHAPARVPQGSLQARWQKRLHLHDHSTSTPVWLAGAIWRDLMRHVRREARRMKLPALAPCREFSRQVTQYTPQRTNSTNLSTRVTQRISVKMDPDSLASQKEAWQPGFCGTHFPYPPDKLPVTSP